MAPEATAWLLASAVALGLLALMVIEQSLVDAERLAFVYRPLRIALAIGAVAALVVGWLRPVPWLLAVLLVAILSVLWAFAVLRFCAPTHGAMPTPRSTERTSGRWAGHIEGRGEQVAGGQAAVGTPFFGDGDDLLLARQMIELVGALDGLP